MMNSVGFLRRLKDLSEATMRSLAVPRTNPAVSDNLGCSSDWLHDQILQDIEEITSRSNGAYPILELNISTVAALHDVAHIPAVDHGGISWMLGMDSRPDLLAGKVERARIGSTGSIVSPFKGSIKVVNETPSVFLSFQRSDTDALSRFAFAESLYAANLFTASPLESTVFESKWIEVGPIFFLESESVEVAEALTGEGSSDYLTFDVLQLLFDMDIRRPVVTASTRRYRDLLKVQRKSHRENTAAFEPGVPSLVTTTAPICPHAPPVHTELARVYETWRVALAA